MIQGDGRKRYARSLAGHHHLGLKRSAVAPMLTPAEPHFFLDSIHVPTYLNGLDALRTLDAAEDESPMCLLRLSDFLHRGT